MYIDSSFLQERMKRAYGGDRQAAEELAALEAPHASAPDGSALLLLQSKHAIRRADGRVRILNKRPEPGAESRLCADLHRGFEDGGSSWTHIPLPADFEPAEVRYAGPEGPAGSAGAVDAEQAEEAPSGRFRLRSTDGRSVEASMLQMGRAFAGLDLVMDGVTEAEIEEAFYAMEEIALPPARREAADNPPIPWSGGRSPLAFDAERQVFAGELRRGNDVVGVELDTADPAEARHMRPMLEAAAGRLEELDAAARRYAARQLLDLKNDVWTGEEEDGGAVRPLDEAGFAARLTLGSLTIGEDGRLTLWYDDGELFAGHTIRVERGADERFGSAELLG
ncbi:MULTISPECIES: DUF2262 domain-containing protein [Saccharibacillus]|uniref:DUF2262 domain-containing protein n=1 Tax=Saccharibacillus TaxID=456492 RepID=UPI00123B3D3F|nr:DUF2262 domain-containing protein [Saccharibacillus sp. WB 17]MWJ32769.1 DUF2262 domain-containing protein [Saccharibacillus sp. WB 17]